MLVVPIAGTSFPARCIKSNASVSNADYKVVLDLLPVHLKKEPTSKTGKAVATLAAGKAGGAVFQIGEMVAKKKRMEFRVGLIERLKKRRKMFLIGSIVSLIGAPVAAGGLMATIINMAESAGRRPAGQEMIPVIVVGVLLFVVGIVLFAIWNMGTLRIVVSDGKYVWLGGASKEFRDQFPEFESTDS
ncbi:hypothetical protein CGZ80_02060 [Rhodopirellula sp. MGV]|nr:hypothetical protein CGZ80_02060 [Rhodopirellula sp. MGV]